MRRRSFIAQLGLAGVAGCASDGPSGAPASEGPVTQQLRHHRTLQGGYLAPALPGVGLPAAPGSGMFIRWLAPAALALRGSELLVADTAGSRLWRADLMSNAVTGMPAAPVGPGTALALGPDLSAWVLDPPARQVLRFARDGRLLQTWRVGTALPSPVALALADGGATLMLADGLGALWSEQRGPGSLMRTVAPEAADGLRISSVDALAAGRDSVFVLDRLAGVVHQVARAGPVLRTLGGGELQQPVALAIDRLERLYVHDAHDHSIKRLHGQAPTLRWSAAELGVQRIGGLAVDGFLLAVSDPLRGQVVVHQLPPGAAP